MGLDGSDEVGLILGEFGGCVRRNCMGMNLLDKLAWKLCVDEALL